MLGSLMEIQRIAIPLHFAIKLNSFLLFKLSYFVYSFTFPLLPSTTFLIDFFLLLLLLANLFCKYRNEFKATQ